MLVYKIILKWWVLLLVSFLLVSCGDWNDNTAHRSNISSGISDTGGSTSNGSEDNTSNGSDDNASNGSDDNTSNGSDDEFNQTQYKGLVFYHKNLPSSAYKLEQIDDSYFNSLSHSKKLQVANKLLTTLFWGYQLNELEAKIYSGTFISDIKASLNTEATDKEWLESYIMDDSYFKQYTETWATPQVLKILTRFYAMKKLDKYHLNNWVAYILTQTIMFSPAYELSTTHTPNISRVYNRLVAMLENESGMRFITYVHMMSDDNWRRFRSPEDNAREMLEIYLQDGKDSDVPLAGKALQNWHLNSDGDTLEVGLNYNTKAINLFGTTIYTGEDFYRELVKSDAFTQGVTNRLVDFFFPKKSKAQKLTIAEEIVSSKPETWQDILLQIIFSKEYLIHNNRALSLEESFYSLAKKMNYRNKRDEFSAFKYALNQAHQSSMKYKLGKLERVPLDTLSFAYYHRYIRSYILGKKADPNETDRNSWQYFGWQENFVSIDKFEHDETDHIKSLRSLVNYLFNVVVARDAQEDEQRLFKERMIQTKNGKELFGNEFDMFVTNDDLDKQKSYRHDNRMRIVYTVLDYLSRLEETYSIKEIK